MHLKRKYQAELHPVILIFVSIILLILTLPLISCAQPTMSQPGEREVISSIVIHGNSITKRYILLRELPFSEGEQVAASELPAMLEKARQNLLNTSLFNFVTISSVSTREGTEIHIEVIERWYIWPTPIFEYTDRNLNSWWKSKDFTRVNYGFRVKWSNFRGRMEDLDFILRLGKNHHFALSYTIPYIDKARRIGVGIDIGFIRMRETGFQTVEDRLEFLYNKQYLIHQYYAGMVLSYRKNIHSTHLLVLRYEKDQFSDTLVRANPDYFYPGKQAAGYLNLFYKLKIDHRDARYYPLAGWYTDLEIYKAGLGFVFEKPMDVFWVKSTSRYYLPISRRFFFGTSATFKWSEGSDHPYFLMQGLGYDRDFVRGYEYYVVDGESYTLFKANIKFSLLPERTSQLKIIPSEKFSRIHYASYVSLYSDAGYVWNRSDNTAACNVLPGQLLLGAGLGLDLVTYYDKVVRIEYSINKAGESGIFVHFIAGI